MVFDAGHPAAPQRLMMAVKGGETLDFPGVVVNEEKALEYARAEIDSTDTKKFNDGEKQI